MTQRRWLFLILAAYLVLATVYSIVTPIFEASDELWHYPMVKYLADNSLALPHPDPNEAWRQEGGQPPLYYMIAAVLTGGIDTSDMATVRRLNPHADIGVVLPDRNANMIVHHASEANWQGTVLAVHIARFFSVALGLCTVIITYALARELFPEWPLVALGAAALNAFLPMFLFISGSVNNDNLSNLLGNLLTLLSVRLLKARTLPHWRDYVILGIVTGAGLLSKLNIGFFIPLIALALIVISVRLKSWHPLVVGGLISGTLTVVIAGWWYWRNWELYGEPTGLSAFLATVGRRDVPANLDQLWAERHSFTQAYWGFFGGVNVPMPDLVYLIFNLFGGFTLISAAVYLVRVALRREWSLERWLPALAAALWPLITFVSYLRWTAETPASQGRLIFGALSALSVWMAVGLVWWLPRRIQPVMMSATAGYFSVVAALVPFTVIAPMYAPPPALPADEVNALEAVFTDPTASNRLALVSGDVLSETVQPDGYVHLTTEWMTATPLERDWSLFVHLTTPDGVVIAQRDVYPGGGTLATSDLPEGFRWRNPIAVRVPMTAYAPMTLDVEVGWYHLPTGERMTLADGADTTRIGQVEVAPRSGSELPNPVSINFDHQLELVGYDVSALSTHPGDEVELTLYWRALRPIEQDYTVFAHVIDPRTATIYAGSDRWPGGTPTSAWKPGDIITDTHHLTVREDTPPGIYELEIGLYTQTPEGGFPRLHIVTGDSTISDNYLYLTRMRVLPLEGAE